MDSTTKRCAICGAGKPLSDFHKCTRGKYGRHAYCKECKRGPKFRLEGRINGLRSSRHGDRSALSREWVEAQLAKGCPVFGVPFSEPGTGQTATSPQVDQFIAQGGYDEENCWVISKKANQIKSNGTPEEIMQVAAWTQIVARFNRTLTQEQFVRLRERMNKTLLRTAKRELDKMAKEVK